MNEVLGLLDSLEATILEGKKIPLTDKVMLEEPVLLNLIDKIRLVLKSDDNIAKKSINSTKEVYKEEHKPAQTQSPEQQSISLKEDAHH